MFLGSQPIFVLYNVVFVHERVTCCAVVAVCSSRCSSHRQRATMRAISMGFSRYLLCRCCLMRRRLCWYRTLFSCRKRLYCWSISPSRLWNTSVACDSLLAAYALRQTRAKVWLEHCFRHYIEHDDQLLETHNILSHMYIIYKYGVLNKQQSWLLNNSRLSYCRAWPIPALQLYNALGDKCLSTK